MYNGEVKIYQDDIDRFLNIAHRFKIKGLLNDKNDDEEVVEQKFDNELIANHDIISEPELQPKTMINHKQIMLPHFP